MRPRVISLLSAVAAVTLSFAPSMAEAQVRYVLPVGGSGGLYGRSGLYGGGYGGLYGGYRGTFAPVGGLGYSYGGLGAYPYGGAGAYPYAYGGGGYPYGYGSAYGVPGGIYSGGIRPYDARPYGSYPGVAQGVYSGYPQQQGMPLAYSSGTPPPRMRTSFSGATFVPRPNTDNKAQMTVLLPSADAEVWFQGVKTTQTGTQRLFESPSLKPDTEYTYTIRARWTTGGASPTEETRTITVRAGDVLQVAFPNK
jgi:uncharacterized protein (TIGR03000 family)